jgi:hypothetical protein
MNTTSATTSSTGVLRVISKQEHRHALGDRCHHQRVICTVHRVVSTRNGRCTVTSRLHSSAMYMFYTVVRSVLNLLKNLCDRGGPSVGDAVGKRSKTLETK